MSFVQLAFLLGGLAVAGPLVAHLVAKPRYKRLPFTMLRFLRSGQTESRSLRKLRDWLILLLRCAVIVLLAVLFARPLLRVKAQPQDNKSIYCLGLDNSTSMAYRDSDGRYLDRSIDVAVEYIKRAEDDGLFNVYTLASEGSAHGLTKSQALAEVRRLAVSPRAANVVNFFSDVRQVSRKADPGDVVSVLLISDFAPNTLRQFERVQDCVDVDRLEYETVTSREPIDNAAVVWAHAVDVAEDKLDVDVLVANHGQVTQNRILTVGLGGIKSESVDVHLPPGEQRTYRMQVKLEDLRPDCSALPLELRLSRGDGLEQDDEYRLAVDLPRTESTSVLVVEMGRGETVLFEGAVNALSKKSRFTKLIPRKVPADRLSVSDLNWADVVVFSSVAGGRNPAVVHLRPFVERGGRLIFFMSNERDGDAAQQLWRQDVLPALPEEWVLQRAYLKAQPSSSRSFGVDDLAAKSLVNYRVDTIALKGYRQCSKHPDGDCLWRLGDGAGFVYLRQIGRGVTVLVNTSIDDSLGLLTKSRASVAFCRYLLGPDNRITQYSFSVDERPVLRMPDMNSGLVRRTAMLIESPDGSRTRAAVSDSFLLLPNPARTGWMKTVGEPAIYAGINLPRDETDLTKPVEHQVAAAMKRAYSVRPTGTDVVATSASAHTEQRPLWRIVAWMLIALLLIEPAIANRLKR